MAKYYYKRYTALVSSYSNKKRTSYTGDQYFTIMKPKTTWPLYRETGASDQLTLNSATGFVCSGTAISATQGLSHQYGYFTIASPTLAWNFGLDLSGVDGQWTNWQTICDYPGYGNRAGLMYSVEKWTATTNYKAGTYVDEVIAEDGTYPNNGRYAADGYYYIKDRMAIQFFMRTGGAWNAATTYVRTNGIWTPAEIRPRVNGAWVG